MSVYITPVYENVEIHGSYVPKLVDWEFVIVLGEENVN